MHCAKAKAVGVANALIDAIQSNATSKAHAHTHTRSAFAKAKLSSSRQSWAWASRVWQDEAAGPPPVRRLQKRHGNDGQLLHGGRVPGAFLILQENVKCEADLLSSKTTSRVRKEPFGAELAWITMLVPLVFVLLENWLSFRIPNP